jgi:hypothetical protein
MEKLSFRRLNFFKGLFTKAEDWIEEQRYHIAKRELHNRSFFTPGVVIGEGSNLKINVNDGQFTIMPGYAIDGYGRDLYLSEPKKLEDPPAAETAYIYIAFNQRKEEPRSNYTNPEYSGEAFIVEDPIVGWTDQPPDNQEKIELGRIHRKAGQSVTDKQLDLRYVKRALSRSLVWAPVRSGNTDLAPSTGQVLSFSEDDEKNLIRSFSDQDEAARAFFVANVYPLLNQDAEGSRIFWRIESSVDNQKIAYYLLLKNFGKKKVTVKWAVYQLNFG